MMVANRPTLNELSRSVFLARDRLERNRQPRHAAGAAGCVNALRQFGLAPTRNDSCVDFASVDVCRRFDSQGACASIDAAISEAFDCIAASTFGVFGSFFAGRHCSDSDHAETLRARSLHNTNVWRFPRT